ncbi:MAG: hypothetical protein B6245_05995 [Desulfobacteraceae bacterium 4572_88]|nr:MAG: hypothetical protein B6245_05995 [Desulfobacteraceae bacterium 4572_88]
MTGQRVKDEGGLSWPACRALTLRLCAFAGFRGDMFFPGALKRIGSDMRGQKSGQRKSANLDGLP